jgi:hypothetical protein
MPLLTTFRSKFGLTSQTTSPSETKGSLNTNTFKHPPKTDA